MKKYSFDYLVVHIIHEKVLISAGIQCRLFDVWVWKIKIIFCRMEEE